MMDRHIWLRCLVLVLLCGCSAVRAGELTLEKLMADFAAVESMQASYREVKTVEILDAPLVSSGTLSYRAPNRFTKEMRKPKHERFVIKNDVIEITKGTDTRVISLDEHPALRALAASFRATLAGDLERLQRYYRLQLEGEHDDWTLQLTPRPDAGDALITSMTLAGSGTLLNRIVTRRIGGERSVMTIRPDTP